MLLVVQLATALRQRNIVNGFGSGVVTQQLALENIYVNENQNAG